jgi:formate-dependent nitrite reductase cytochrome c552 subunit
MSAVFPKWTNRLPLMIVTGAVLIGGAVTAGVWYYFTPEYTRVGYQPVQPVAFSHNIHAGQLGIDCRYCHSTGDKSWYSNIPTAELCMNCHGPTKGNVLGNDPKLALVRESAASGKPIPWVQIHKTPEFVYFNHSVHLRRGISCVECHGRIDQMDEVHEVKSLSMTFCLDCHRDPAAHIRPLDKITDLGWKAATPEAQREMGSNIVHNLKVQSLQSCSACHR